MRHGKTDWNLRHKLQGKTDIPLNDMGRQMASDACERYKDVHFDVCYCSPLTRARDTAELVLKGRNIPIIIDERLAEMGFGIYEGIEEVFEKPECPVRVLFFNPDQYVAVNGAESLEDLRPEAVTKESKGIRQKKERPCRLFAARPFFIGLRRNL